MAYPKPERIDRAKKVSESGAFLIMEEDECSRIYFFTDKLIFTVSTLLPGQKTPLDTGHKDAYEIVYCIQGKAVLHLPQEDRYEKLEQGDAVCIPSGESHQVINVGESLVKLSWSLAPHMGK